MFKIGDKVITKSNEQSGRITSMPPGGAFFGDHYTIMFRDGEQGLFPEYDLELIVENNLTAPIFLKNELSVHFDCDDTLVMWYPKIVDVYVSDPYDETNTYGLAKHEKHIKLLKDYKNRGYQVVVWSAGGSKWAKAVVDALELQEYVDVIMVKPVKYVDDLPASEILGTRVYIKP